jgi:hypothetical protein
MSSPAPKSISFDCPHCRAFQTVVLEDAPATLAFACGHCGKAISFTRPDQDPIRTCPVCGAADFYQHKDFDKRIGLAVFVAGAVLVPWTYAVSLLAALAIDAALFPFFPWMSVCYACKSEFRGWGKNSELDRFSHETAAKYEYGNKKVAIEPTEKT